MGAVVGERSFGFERPHVGFVDDETSISTSDLNALAKAILAKEPYELRDLIRTEPGLVREWVNLIKDEQLHVAGASTILHDALDHIRLATLSPLKFAAE